MENGEWRIRKAKTIVPTKKLSVDARSDKGDCGVGTHGIEAFNLRSKIGIFQFSSPALVPNQGTMPATRTARGHEVRIPILRGP